jgi:hypothetical protein
MPIDQTQGWSAWRELRAGGEAFMFVSGIKNLVYLVQLIRAASVDFEKSPFL